MEWLAHGDRNSKVFHLKASERKRKNKIAGLMDQSVNWCSNPGNFKDIIHGYFLDLFTSSSPSNVDINSVLTYVKAKVTTDMNNKLLRPFTSDEVHKAMLDMHLTKAPGLDGLPTLFY